MAGNSQPLTREIRVNRNRRLYDRAASGYITFEDIESFVREGIHFRVTDMQSGRDLTQGILLSILIRRDQQLLSGEAPCLTVEFLRDVISLSQIERHGQELEEFLNHTMQSLLNAQPGRLRR
jgi:polyhydroxyalkanoate synthesis repressor PhaR